MQRDTAVRRADLDLRRVGGGGEADRYGAVRRVRTHRSQGAFDVDPTVRGAQ